MSVPPPPDITGIFTTTPRPPGELFDPSRAREPERVWHSHTHTVPGLGWFVFFLGIVATSETVQVALAIIRLVKGL